MILQHGRIYLTKHKKIIKEMSIHLMVLKLKLLYDKRYYKVKH